MTDVIVLTAEEADKVRGFSPRKSGAALSPAPIKDGRYILGTEVLDDPAHEDVRDFLASLPLEAFEKLPRYTDEDADQPATVEAADLHERSEAFGAEGFAQDKEAERIARV